MTLEFSSILEELGGSTLDPKLEDVKCEENRSWTKGFRDLVLPFLMLSYLE